jgi:hypothetical protein
MVWTSLWDDAITMQSEAEVAKAKAEFDTSQNELSQTTYEPG